MVISAVVIPAFLSLACSQVASFAIQPSYLKGRAAVFSENGIFRLSRDCGFIHPGSTSVNRFSHRFFRTQSHRISMSATTSAPEDPAISDRVRAFLERIPGGTSVRALQSADRAWSHVRSEAFARPPATPAVVERKGRLLPAGAKPDFDVAVCGGTLGIFVGAALARKGWRVAVIEQVPAPAAPRDPVARPACLRRRSFRRGFWQRSH